MKSLTIHGDFIAVKYFAEINWQVHQIYDFVDGLVIIDISGD
jgi:hypothetical protein